MDGPVRFALAWAFAVAIGAAALWSAEAVAQERSPLLMEGKSTLFQRVLTRPGAAMHSEPTPVGAEATRSVTPFSVYYVYDRKVIQNQEWVEVGPKSSGGTLGWMPTDDTIDWKQTMTAAFTPRVGRDRALFFRDDEELIDLLESELLLPAVETQRTAIAAGDLPADFPVIAIEPAAFVDFNDQFYLLPILSAEEVYLDSGFNVRLLEVASVPLLEGEEQDLADPEVRREMVEDVGDEDEQIKDFAAAIAFVVDTTVSMDPYINRAREMVRSIYETIEAEGLLSQVSFALVGFRDNVEGRPELEYVSRIFADFDAGHDPGQFLHLVEDAAAATDSTRGFIEDSYAGIKTALDHLSWDDRYGERIIILITDAGPRRANDPYAQTGLDAEQLRSIARDKGVAIWPIHLLTPEGANDHQSAAAQYRQLYELKGEPLYTPIEAGSVVQFGAGVGSLAQRVVQTIRQSAAGQIEQEPEPPMKETAEDPQIAEIARKAQLLGRIMQLAWLGKKEEAQAPRVFRAWLVDRDLASPDVPTLEVRVFLTKNQLSDMQQTLKAILEAGESAQEGSVDFFNQIRSAAAAMGRDPSVVGREDARNLVELGLLGEYLDGLPYDSKVMAIDEDFWHELSIGAQQEFIDEIKAKINLYETYHDDTDRWLVLGDERIEPGDTVYPVPLEDLP